jgi:hypothetical protein
MSDIKGDFEVETWEEVGKIMENDVKPNHTVVITGPFNEDVVPSNSTREGDEDLVLESGTGFRIRWVEGTDLTPLGGIKGSENAQINYLNETGNWLEIPAF